MSNTVTIEKASVSDIYAIAEIEKKCFSVPWSETAIEDFINNPLCVMFCAKHNEKTIGYVGLYIIFEDCDIANVAVIPEFRNRGIAKKLMEYAVSFANEKNVKKLMLEVRASNVPAISLYEKLGFSTVGIRKNYYTQPKEDALLMDKTIGGQDF